LHRIRHDKIPRKCPCEHRFTRALGRGEHDVRDNPCPFKRFDIKLKLTLGRVLSDNRWKQVRCSSHNWIDIKSILRYSQSQKRFF